MSLENITLAGVTHPLRGLVLIVGSNSTGKTTFLSDVYSQAVRNTSNVPTTEMLLKWTQPMFSGNFQTYSNQLITKWLEGQVETTSQAGDGRYGWTNPNSQTQSQGFDLSGSAHDRAVQVTSSDPQLILGEAELGKSFKGSVFTHFNIESRFSFSESTGFTFTDRRPSQLLFKNASYRNELNKYLDKYFSKKVFIQNVDAANYQLLLGDSNVPEPGTHTFDADGIAQTLIDHKVWKDAHPSLHTVSEEGHGVRAFLQLMVGLLDPNSVAAFIDEPEIHLYPDIKRRLGRDIAELSKKKQIFIVTHDTDIIDGLVGTEVPFSFIRLKTDRTTTFVDFDKARIRAVSSAKKTPDALKVGFYDFAVFTEGITDRYVYQSVFTHKGLMDGDGLSTTFVSCNGKDRIPEHIKFALEIEMKFAVIVDFDALLDDKNRRGGAVIGILRLMRNYDQFNDTVVDVLLSDITDLQALVSGIPYNSVGLGGDLSRYPNGVRPKIRSLLTSLARIGIFVVPKGAVESWVGEVTTTAPEVVVSKYISRCNSTWKPLTDFCRSIASYLSSV